MTDTLRAVESMYAGQLSTWPMLRDAVRALGTARTRQLRVRWFDVHVRNLPHRIVSTTAPVDSASIAARPCFLCTTNRPAEQTGTEFGDFLILANPFPILDGHLTVVHREHRPQEIRPFLRDALSLASNLPGYFVVYNGPKCGASAPDHMHFQAARRTLLPLQAALARFDGISIPDWARTVLVSRGRSASELEPMLNRFLDVLADVTHVHPEPLINFAAYFDSGTWTAALFARSKHRPAAFESGRLLVSPAAIDLCGVLVAPRSSDFDRITAADIEAVFEEVSLPHAAFEEVRSRCA